MASLGHNELKIHETMFTFPIISEHWDGDDNWNPSSLKAKTYLFCIFNNHGCWWTGDARPVDCVLSIWGKIMIPMYRLWLHSLYGLHGPHCPLSLNHSLTLMRQGARALSYYSDLTLSQEFQPMEMQLSMKAALPLAKILATALCRSSKTGPRALASMVLT